ncbi:exonuclease III [Anaerohalosphaera lusitana]|uniref:Exonuclease III n=1 Tax=Anaerohalosphaera lusitana TaxID=1936003 RepID=A0A1U9NHG3_9BACT|nr:endonuclease/exonuclease/phosphatase family protein [Anaerohalosphaera lusitana]AQT67050.1 exonuclease III [Anaerohalosphaera lusitana]
MTIINKRNVLTLFALIMLIGLNSCKTTDAKDRRKELKLINWNTLYSFNHKRSTGLGANWIKQQAPDVLGLQELNGNTEKSLNEMAKSWGHEYSVILKEKGFPVGLTSREPIEVIERKVEGFHHGLLHCRTFGIHFFVVHFWPGKDHEARYILNKAKALLEREENVIVMGDFNSHSRKDSDFHATKEFEPLYDVVDMFEKAGFVDVVNKHDKKALVSFGSPILIPKWASTMKEVKARQARIDFIFADKALAEASSMSTILRSDKLDNISDHYPVIAKFSLPLR